MNTRICTLPLVPILIAVATAGSSSSFANHPFLRGISVCSSTADTLWRSCLHDAYDDYYESIAICLNENDRSELGECENEVKDERREVISECRDIREARKDLCDEIGEEAYAPDFGPDFASNFVDPRDIGVTVNPHPYLPLVNGNRWVYEGTFEDDDGEEVTETITVTVTDKIKMIDGIPCVVVKDVVEEEGELIEDTDDWFAQDIFGNVWYCGEISLNYETFDGDDPEEAQLVDIDGSWKSGEEGAKAGILLPAVPEVGMFIRQEVAWGEAEDVIEIVDVTGTQEAPAASCDGNCLVTRDFTPLEPGTDEFKYYAPGVGMIAEEAPEDDERVELIEVELH
ncbi:hypothetical protein HBA55_14175 [Pseudomaricurvus alkylphenolicus]|jgi:hypothetical protein|uniref:hypothetical protein n=1 Tax=Pseudomaricurvus alkylphenolicus TaxID=1306991 RepID=UPI00141ED87A|nr:hypothetical protein [Pseudomaricurvus alkylphenolicus]NIB40744.1 hypothetical protein [Pseudomaricurvus alkylphenolicus]